MAQNQVTLFWGELQYHYPWLRPIPIQDISQLPREHTNNTAIKGAKRYSNVQRCEVLIYMDEFSRRHMTASQLPEPGTRYHSATINTLNLTKLSWVI